MVFIIDFLLIEIATFFFNRNVSVVLLPLVEYKILIVIFID